MPKTATKPAKKIPGKNTFQGIADAVGARAADLADEVYRNDPKATLADLRDELEYLMLNLEGFMAGDGEDGDPDDDTLLATLR